MAALGFCAHAGAADFSFGADYWGYDVRGQVDRNGDVLDFQSDLDVKARTHTQYLAAWNTGPGWWKPDLAFSYTPIKASGQHDVPGGTRFGGLLFPPTNNTVLGDADLADLSVSLRYPLTLGATHVWGGLTLKRLNGHVTVRDQNDTQEDQQDFNELFPMLHAAVAAPLASWLTLAGQADFIKYGSNSAWDLRAGVSVGVYGPVGLNLGWQGKHYHVESGSYRLNATLSGATAGLYFNFR